jgi:tetratricopeptide (TPR) repeat protein
MTTIFFRLITVGVLGITLLTVVGCKKTKKVTKSNVTSPSNPSGDVENVAIEELLARTDLTKSARSAFERLKNLGQESMPQTNAELIIKNSYQLSPVLVTSNSRTGSRQVALPSLSRHEGAADETFPEDALSATAYLKKDCELALIGIDHFKNRPVYDLSDATRNDCVDWMQRIFATLPYADSTETWKQLSQTGSDLQKQSKGLPDEPMFCLCRGVVAGELKDQIVAAKFLQKASEAFSVSHYPTRLPILSYRYSDRYVTLVERKGYFKQGAAFQHWIRHDMRASGHEQRLLLADVNSWIDLMILNRDMPAIKDFWDAVTESKQLTSWQREMILGRLNFESGYYYRGTGFADTVTEEGWKKLKEYCDIAHKHFEKARKINPRFPEAARNLMAIAMLGYSNKNEEAWFNLAIEFEPEYLWAYYTRQNGLRARWGGSPKEQLDFFTAQNKKHDSPAIAYMLPESLFRLRWQDEMEPKAWKKLISKPEVAKQVILVLDKILTSDEEIVIHQKIYNRDFFLTVKAFFAFQSGQFKVAEKAFDELDGRINGTAVTKLGLFGGGYELLRSSAYAFTSEYQMDARELNELLGSSFEERTQNADKILELTDGLPEWVGVQSGGLFFKLARDRALIETGYASGKQVNLGFDENFTIWNSADFSQNKFLSPTSVMFDNRSNNPKFSLILGAKTPGNKIFTADFELPAADKEIETASEGLFCPALVMGKIVKANSEEFQSFAVGISRTPPQDFNNSRINNALSGKLSFGSNDFRVPLFQYYFDLKPGKNQLKVFFGAKYLEIYVNEQFVCRSFSERFVPIDNVQVAQPGSANGRGIATVSNLTLQRWLAGPPPTIEKDAKKLVDYYTKAVKKSPEDRWPTFWLAHALHLQKDYDAAIPLYEKAIAMGITPKFAGFYLGDALARAGKYKRANTWYEKVIDSKTPSCPTLFEDHENFVGARGTVEQWAAFRLKWNLINQEGGVSKQDPRLQRLKKIRPDDVVKGPKFSSIANALLNRSGAPAKSFRDRIDVQMRFYQRLKPDQKEMDKLAPLLDAAANDEPYVEGDKPLYLSFENEEKFFFPHFERQSLHRHFRRFYEPL